MTPPDDATREQPAVEPTVTTDPAPGAPHRWWSAIPRHLGRARTSTVVLVLLFLATGVLYLYVKPEDTTAASTRSDTGVEQPAPVDGGTTTTPPPTETQPVPTTEQTPSSEVPTEPTTTVPEDTTTTVPEETTGETTSEVPTDTTTVPELPTTEEPTG